MKDKVKKKKCKNCGTRYEVSKNDPPFKNWCSVSCAVEMANSKREKALEAKRLRNERLENLTPRKLNKENIRWQHKQTQAKFNKLRKLQELKWFKDRGIEPECISCGGTNMDWCCGHFKTVGSSPELRYDPKNTHLQCNYNCNMNLSGNINGNKTSRGYKQGLRDRFGEEEGNAIIEYCETSNSTKKWTCDELEAMRKEFNKQIKELTSLI